MSKVLYFDFENSFKSLGDEKTIAKKFGFPIMRSSGWEEARDVIASMMRYNSKLVEVPLFDDITAKVTQRVWEINPRLASEKDKSTFKEDTTLVFDTISELVKKYTRELSDGGKRKLGFGEWGEIKSGVDVFTEFLNGCPANVVVNSHAKTQKDDDLGMITFAPAIEGSSREDIAKWFDFVFYTIVRKDESGEYTYEWVTRRDDRYRHAKDRSTLLDPIIPQDYNIVREAAQKRGWSNFKVMIIGEPGTGKTLSLKTLVTNNKEEEKK